MTLPIRIRLAGMATLVSAALLAGVGLASYLVLGRMLENDATARLVGYSAALPTFLRLQGGAATLEYDTHDLDEAAFIQDATEYFQVFDAASGRLLIQSERLATLGLGLTSAEVRAFRANPVQFDIQTDAGSLRIATTVITAEQDRVYVVQVGVPLKPIDITMARYGGLLARMIPAASLLASVPAWWLSGFALTPLTQLAAAARTLEGASPRRRLPLRGARDPVDQIAGAFNARLEQIEQLDLRAGRPGPPPGDPAA